MLESHESAVQILSIALSQVAENNFLVILGDADVEPVHTPLEVLVRDTGPVFEIEIAEGISKDLESFRNVAVY